jgi:hypothetical protein
MKDTMYIEVLSTIAKCTSHVQPMSVQRALPHTSDLVIQRADLAIEPTLPTTRTLLCFNNVDC